MSGAESASGSGRGAAIGRVASLFALVVLLSFGAYRWIATRGLETTDDAFVEGTLSYLAAEVQGRVFEVAVEEHARVKAGEVLVRLDDAEARARIARAQADLSAAHNRMVSAEAAAAAADAEGKAATVESWRMGRELERIESLTKRGAASSQELDAARADRDAALARVRAAAMRAEAERGLLGSEAPVRQAEAALREAELGLERTQLAAPFDAVVGRKNVEPGNIVRPGQALLALSRVERRWVEANFKETQIARMRRGAPATVVVDAFPGYVFRGHVESFSPASGAKYALIPPEPAAGNFTKVVQRVPVRIVLDEVENGEGRHPIDRPEDMPDLAIGLSSVVTVDVR
jgi:membrane fusion protein (multidrug efflux system)